MLNLTRFCSYKFKSLQNATLNVAGSFSKNPNSPEKNNVESD